MKKNYSDLLSSVLFFILGLILFTNPNAVVKFISYVLGGILIVVGLYKSVNYYIQDKRLGVVNRNEIAFGITAIVLGIIFIVLASAIEFLIRVVFGAWMIIEGLNKISRTFYTTDRTSKFYTLLVIGIVFIGAGIYVVMSSNLVLQIIGLFMVIYAIIDLVSFFIYNKNVKIKEDDEEENVKELNVIVQDNVVEAEVTEKKKKTKKEKTDKKKN